MKDFDDKQNKIQTITQSDFERYLAGETILNDDIWVYNKQDTQTKSIDGVYKKYFEDDLLKVSSFFKSFDKQQYQDGKIKIYDDNTNFGFDAEYTFSRENSDYLLGLSYKKDSAKDNNQYLYNDVTIAGGKIIAVNSDALGDIMATSNTDNTLFALYAKDSIMLSQDFKLELSLRADQVEFDVDNISYYSYNGSTEKYTPILSPTKTSVTTKTNLYTPKIELIYKLNNTTNFYASIGHGEQTLSDSEILANIQNDKPTDLPPEEATNFEIGIKHSSLNYLVSVALYRTYLKNEIVEFKDQINNVKYFEGAGKTEKTGLEVGFKYNISDNIYTGFNYSYSHYIYTEYESWDSTLGANVDFSGNKMEGIPTHKYAIYAGFKDTTRKINGKVEFLSSSSYYTDRLNSIKYQGYDFVTNLSLTWEPKESHKLILNANNVFDKKYATNVTTVTDTVYAVGAPRSLIVSYKYSF